MVKARTATRQTISTRSRSKHGSARGRTLRVGIDVGGTFTDLAAVESWSGSTVALKVATTPREPERAVVDALAALLARYDEPPSIEFLAHATTIATNALLGQVGLELPRVALVTTHGFRDVIEIGRQNRSEVYDLFVERPRPLVKREDRLTVRERLDYRGNVLVPLDEASLEHACTELAARNVAAVAVCLLHSYANDEHERRVAEALCAALPGARVTLSSEVNPEYREYERFSTAVVNAALAPIVERYLERLVAGIRSAGIEVPLYVMRSDGGLSAAPAVLGIPAALVESGPAGGAIAAAALGRRIGIQRLLSFDMGGTTAKSGAIVNGVPQVVTEFEAAGKTHSGRSVKGSGYPVRFPFVDLAEVSAGGGTIAWVDDAGALRVGPLSAGADPGPACYGKSERATVTDANVVLGRLNAEHLLGGAFPIDARRSREAVARLARSLDAGVEATAAGIVTLADDAMAKVLRIVTVERGLDPREFTLVAFGGGGPLHACAVARGTGYLERPRPRAARSFLRLRPAVCTAARQLRAPRALRRRRRRHCRTARDLRALRRARPRDASRPRCAHGCVRVGVRRALSRPEFRTHDRVRSLGRVRRAEFPRRAPCPLRLRRPRRCGRTRERARDRTWNAAGPARAARRAAPGRRGLPGDGARHLDGRRLRAGAGRAARGPRARSHAPRPDGRRAVRHVHIRRARLVAPLRGRPPAPGCKGVVMDPIAAEIVKSALVYASEEMGIAVRNSAYSPNIKERLDHSCALFDRSGRLIAQAEHIPVHLGSLPWGLRRMLDVVERERGGMREGEMWVANDPYVTGTHLNDVTLVRPIFHRGALAGYAANKAHHADVGGAAPGSMPASAADLFAEGLVVPPMRLVVDDRILPEMAELFRANSRTPDARIGDLRAQAAGNYTGERRLLELCDRYGGDAFERACARALDDSEKRMRAALRRLGDGVFHATDYLEDAAGRASIAIVLRMELRDGSARFDYTGTSEQVAAPLNAVFGVTISGVHYALRAVTDPTIPMNEGCFRPVEIFAPEGTLLNPRRPAPVSGGNVETSTRNADVVLQALAKAAPERVPASSGGTMSNVMLGGTRPDGTTWAFYETNGCGMGARPTADGLDAIQCHMTNTLNTPIEAIEREFPLRVVRYEIAEGTGGDGRRRGGNGLIRSLELVEGSAQATLLADRHTLAPPGAEGGLPGACGRHALVRDGTESTVPAKTSLSLEPGDVLTIQTPGGGGYGAP